MKYLITGGSGYIGGRLMDLLLQRDDTEVVNLDIRPPAVPRPRTRFVRMDIRDRGMRALLEARAARRAGPPRLRAEPDPGRAHDVRHRRERHPERARRRLRARASRQLLVASSTTAYGAWPDNPVPLTEEHPVRGLPDYEYARDKTEIDRLCQLWAAQHPDRVMTIVRPDDRVRPERGQLHRPLLDERARSSRCSTARTSTGSSCTRRTSWTRCRACCSSGAAASSTSPPTARSRSRGGAIAGLKTRQMPRADGQADRRRRMAAARSERRGAARADRLRPLPWIASNEKLKARAGLDPALHEPGDLRDRDAREGHRGARRRAAAAPAPPPPVTPVAG